MALDYIVTNHLKGWFRFCCIPVYGICIGFSNYHRRGYKYVSKIKLPQPLHFSLLVDTYSKVSIPKMKRPKRDIPDKHPITNIDPVSGVTPTQLYEQAKYLITTIKIALNFTDHQKNTAINNAVHYTYLNQQRGKVPKHNYDDFKDYFYTTLKNEVKKIYVSKNTHLHKFNSTFAPLEWVNSDDYPTNPSFEDDELHRLKINSLKEAIKKLNPKEQRVIELFLQGNVSAQILKETGVRKTGVYSIVNKLRNIIKNEMKAGKLEIADFKPELFDLPLEKKNLHQRMGKMKNFNTFLINEKAKLAGVYPDVQFYSISEMKRKFKIGDIRLYELLKRFKAVDSQNLDILGVYYRQTDIDSLNLPIRTTQNDIQP